MTLQHRTLLKRGAAQAGRRRQAGTGKGHSGSGSHPETRSTAPKKKLPLCKRPRWEKPAKTIGVANIMIHQRRLLKERDPVTQAKQ